MKRNLLFLLLVGGVIPRISSGAIDLKQAKFTQVVNDVQVISASDKTSKSATLNETFKVPDILRTGPNSRAELVAEDQTITRVGANTVFSFDPAKRTIDLEKGSLLFHSPKGKGGGTIRTGSATASVLGTTIVVTTTPNGGFKILVLEGEAEIKFLKGVSQRLSSGHMTFVLPGGSISPIIVFRLDQNIRGSQLVQGFHTPLPSLNRIEDGITKQNKLIQKGKASDTGLLVGDQANSSQVQAVDSSSLQNYFSQVTAYEPIATGNGYLSIDGFLVSPEDETAPASQALYPAWALSVDAAITGSTLDSHHTFTDSGAFQIESLGNDTQTEFLPNPFAGFFARNLSIGVRHIDMTSYSALDFFDFLAAQNFKITGSLSFDHFENLLYLTAGGVFAIAPGSVVSANAFNLSLASFGPMNFNNVKFKNPGGSVSLSTLSDLTLTGGGVNSGSTANLSGRGVTINGANIYSADVVNINSDSTSDPVSAITLKNASISGDGGVFLSANGGIKANGSVLNSLGSSSFVLLSSDSGSVSLSGGTVSANNGVGIVQFSAGRDVAISGANLNAQTLGIGSGGSITVNGGAKITAPMVVLNAGDGILLDNVTMNSAALQATAANDVRMGGASHNLDLSGLTDVNISGHTLALQNVNFGHSPHLYSDVGQLAANPNTGRAIERGYVNFITGVTYNSVLVTSANQASYVNPASGPGIFIGKR